MLPYTPMITTRKARKIKEKVIMNTIESLSFSSAIALVKSSLNSNKLLLISIIVPTDFSNSDSETFSYKGPLNLPNSPVASTRPKIHFAVVERLYFCLK
jgi:hypothetical protein